MEIQVMSDRKQRFGTVSYYLCGLYFRKHGGLLHHAVWEHHNGAIPEGFHVHHIDGDRSNNGISNLALKESTAHLSDHAKGRSEYNLMNINRIRPLASIWHGSEVGRAWHSKHAKATWASWQPVSYVCDQCGKAFESMDRYGENERRFCSNNCRAQHRRLSGIDDEVRICPQCGGEFTVNKYAKKVCCSRDCGVRRRWRQ